MIVTFYKKLLYLLKKKLKRVLRFMGIIWSDNKWPKVSPEKIKYFKENVHIMSSVETINAIKNTIENQHEGAYMRFGDGDIYLLLGLNDMLHVGNKRMAKEMKEAIKLNVGSLQKGLSIHSKMFGYEEGMASGIHLVNDIDALKYLSVTHKFINIKKLVSPVALHHLSRFHLDQCISFLIFLKNTKPIFVGNQNIKPELVQKLFGGLHIKTPLRDSYLEIDRIENDLIKILDFKRNEFQVVVVAMGCPGRILQKRILKKGYNVYLFDFGSLLDAFNGKDTRDWISLTGGIDYYQEMLDKI